MTHHIVTSYRLDFRVMDLWHFAVLSGFRVLLSLIYITVVVNLFGAFFALFLLLYIIVFEYVTLMTHRRGIDDSSTSFFRVASRGYALIGWCSNPLD